MIRKQLRQIVTLAMAAVFLVSAAPVFAASGSNGLGVTPKKNYTIQKGHTVKDHLYISDLSTSQPLKVSISVTDFSAAGEGGTPQLHLKKDAKTTPWSLKPFLHIPKTFTVNPKQSKYIPISITIPKDQGAGSYYSAIRYSAQNANGGQKNVNISASSTTLLFVNVPGKTKEYLQLKQFGAYQPDPTGAGGHFAKFTFGLTPPTELAYRVDNLGNVAEQPKGSVKVTDTFGNQTYLIKHVNPKQQLALRGQTRRFETCLKPKNKDSDNNKPKPGCSTPHLWPGRYTAKMSVFYGLPGNATQQIAAKTTFWYIPWWFLVAVLIVVAIIVFLIMSLYRKVSGRRRSSRGKRRR
jgi:hypothetical protein